MVLRHPLEGDTFDEDNQLVWELINSVFHGTDGWNWISEYASTCDGRKAYLNKHYLDDTNCDTILNQAYDIVYTMVYRGESRNFTFEKFSCKLKGAYTDIESLGEKIPESAKIRFLVRSVTAPNLDNYKGNIKYHKTDFNTFEKCVNFLKMKVGGDLTNTTRNVSAWL